MNQSIINNLEILSAAVEAQPEPMFNLRRFKNETECGTLFCTVGLATTIPHFQELGFKMVEEYPKWFMVQVGDDAIYDEGVSEEYLVKKHLHVCSNPPVKAIWTTNSVTSITTKTAILFRQI